MATRKHETSTGINRRVFFNAPIVAAATAFASRQLAAADTPQPSQTANLPAQLKDQFAPGDVVPVSGIYDVTHDKLDGDDHALPHPVTAIAGMIFPPCRWCGKEVRFVLHQAAVHLDADRHFRG